MQTKDLDGETNLKAKQELKGFDKAMLQQKTLVQGSLEPQEKPNENLEEWDALLSMGEKDRPLPCSIENLLLRGCVLRNTEWIQAVVVYVGMETKIMMNSKKVRPKVSNIMKIMNKLLYSLFVFQLVIVFLFTILATSWFTS